MLARVILCAGPSSGPPFHSEKSQGPYPLETPLTLSVSFSPSQPHWLSFCPSPRRPTLGLGLCSWCFLSAQVLHQPSSGSLIPLQSFFIGLFPSQASQPPYFCYHINLYYPICLSLLVFFSGIIIFQHCIWSISASLTIQCSRKICTSSLSNFISLWHFITVTSYHWNINSLRTGRGCFGLAHSSLPTAQHRCRTQKVLSNWMGTFLEGRFRNRKFPSWLSSNFLSCHCRILIFLVSQFFLLEIRKAVFICCPEMVHRLTHCKIKQTKSNYLFIYFLLKRFSGLFTTGLSGRSLLI